MITGTVAVCTRNRADVLAQCLTTLDAQIGEDGQLEVVVVDNGSSDATPALVQRWLDGDPGPGPRRRTLPVPDPGLSRARNAVLEDSDRDVVLFIDDDALAPPTWAATHLQAHAEVEHTGITGGPVGLEWPAGRPDWLPRSVDMWYSGLELGDETGPFPTEHGPYGCNMAVNRKAALAAGGFDPSLGRVGRRLLSGEEPDLTRRLRDGGWGVVYAAGAAVVHQVTADRLRPRWLLRRGWAQGVTDSRLDLLAGRHPSRRSMARQSGRELRVALDAARRWRRNRPDPDALADLVVALCRAGAGVELARAALERRPSAEDRSDA